MRAKEKVVGSVDPKELMFMQRILPAWKEVIPLLPKILVRANFSGNDLKTYEPKDIDSKTATSIYLNICKLNNDYDIYQPGHTGRFKGTDKKS